MAKLIIELDVPGWTPDELRKAVHDLDELDSGEGEGIAIEYVKAMDVLTYVLTDQLGLMDGTMTEKIIEGLEANEIEIPFRPDQKSYYYVTKDEIRP